MDLSDGENENNSLICDSNDKNNSEMALRDENDSLKCQIESFRNEAIFVEQESRQERERLEKQISILQQALQGMQHQLIALNQKGTDTESQTNPSIGQKEVSFDEKSCDTMTSKTALLISLISIYFNVHPNGTTSDSISTYLSQQTHISDTNLLSTQFIDSFLAKYPKLFTQLEIDSNRRKLWRYSGFQT